VIVESVAGVLPAIVCVAPTPATAEDIRRRRMRASPQMAPTVAVVPDRRAFVTPSLFLGCQRPMVLDRCKWGQGVGGSGTFRWSNLESEFSMIGLLLGSG
jgi:hypothetical protein